MPQRPLRAGALALRSAVRLKLYACPLGPFPPLPPTLVADRRQGRPKPDGRRSTSGVRLPAASSLAHELNQFGVQEIAWPRRYAIVAAKAMPIKQGSEYQACEAYSARRWPGAERLDWSWTASGLSWTLSPKRRAGQSPSRMLGRSSRLLRSGEICDHRPIGGKQFPAGGEDDLSRRCQLPGSPR